MPCSSSEGMGSVSGYDVTARHQVERLTRVSCDIMRLLTNANVPMDQFSNETREWWLEHQAHDAARQQAAQAQADRERHRQAGLSKLSPEERKALGL